jgi:hypothetical protein
MNTTEVITPTFLIELVDNGIEISIHKNSKIGLYYNLHLEAKSHMWLYFKDGQWRVNMRYGDDFTVDNIHDLIEYAKQGMHGRDFIHDSWSKLIDLIDTRN